jgi:hypothetical protein
VTVSSPPLPAEIMGPPPQIEIREIEIRDMDRWFNVCDMT